MALQDDINNKLARFSLTNPTVEMTLKAVSEGVDECDAYKMCIVFLCENQETMEELRRLYQEKFNILKEKLAILERNIAWPCL